MWVLAMDSSLVFGTHHFYTKKITKNAVSGGSVPLELLAWTLQILSYKDLWWQALSMAKYLTLITLAIISSLSCSNDKLPFIGPSQYHLDERCSCIVCKLVLHHEYYWNYFHLKLNNNWIHKHFNLHTMYLFIFSLYF